MNVREVIVIIWVLSEKFFREYNLHFFSFRFWNCFYSCDPTVCTGWVSSTAAAAMAAHIVPMRSAQEGKFKGGLLVSTTALKIMTVKCDLSIDSFPI